LNAEDRDCGTEIEHGFVMVSRKLSIARGGIGVSVGIAVRRLDGGTHSVIWARIDVSTAVGIPVVVAAPGT